MEMGSGWVLEKGGQLDLEQGGFHSLSQDGAGKAGPNMV